MAGAAATAPMKCPAFYGRFCPGRDRRSLVRHAVMTPITMAADSPLVPTNAVNSFPGSDDRVGNVGGMHEPRFA